MLSIQDFYVSLEDPMLNYKQQIFGSFFLNSGLLLISQKTVSICTYNTY